MRGIGISIRLARRVGMVMIGGEVGLVGGEGMAGLREGVGSMVGEEDLVGGEERDRGMAGRVWALDGVAVVVDHREEGLTARRGGSSTAMA